MKTDLRITDDTLGSWHKFYDFDQPPVTGDTMTLDVVGITAVVTSRSYDLTQSRVVKLALAVTASPTKTTGQYRDELKNKGWTP